MGAPNALALAADVFDPPPWSAGDRPPLEPHQLPPEREFASWGLEAGRGAGKTEACSRYYARYMNMHPGTRGRIIAPTLGDAIEACVVGPSGIQAVDPRVRWVPSAAGGAKLFWPNGSMAMVLGGHTESDVDRLRAKSNVTLDWLEEAAAMAWLEEVWDQSAMGRRVGQPHLIWSSTPRATKAYRRIREETQHLTTGVPMTANPHNPDEWVAMMESRYDGTRLGRQELKGELLTDVQGAYWTDAVIHAGRVHPEQVPDIVRMVVAIDPATTSNDDSDDTGIIVAGKGVDGHAYVFADKTCHLSPDGWATRAIRAHDQHKADKIVGETNNGGDMVESVIRAQPGGKKVAYKSVTASRGKATRAEPVAALYGDGKNRQSQVHHVGGFPELEDQMTTWVPDDADSPDRVDALVWALTELMLGPTSSWRPA